MNNQNCIIIIDRVSEYKNKLRLYSVYLDRDKIGKINNGGRIVYNCEPGEHQLFVKIDWVKSDFFQIHLAENETKYIEVSTSPNWTSLVGLICCGVLAGLGAMIYGFMGAAIGGGIGGAIYGTVACKPQLIEKNIL